MKMDDFINTLSEEQKKALREMKTTEEMTQYLEKNATELTMDQMEMISGGRLWDKCGELGPELDCKTVLS